MIKHFLPRFILGAFAFFFLGLQFIETDKGGGNSGMDIKLWLFISLAILLLEGIYLIGEMFYLFSKSRYRLAWIDFSLLLIGGIVFLILMRLT
ncbi:hypothetical protein [Pedobacter terrae]|uniref:hypothetical protein n=1 Tax=Pedobacter terrae TaxID=405671 RepID=UPI002FF743C8